MALRATRHSNFTCHMTRHCDVLPRLESPMKRLQCTCRVMQLARSKPDSLTLGRKPFTRYTARSWIKSCSAVGRSHYHPSHIRRKSRSLPSAAENLSTVMPNAADRSIASKRKKKHERNCFDHEDGRSTKRQNTSISNRFACDHERLTSAHTRVRVFIRSSPPATRLLTEHKYFTVTRRPAVAHTSSLHDGARLRRMRM
jgi:hypothetical protein